MNRLANLSDTRHLPSTHTWEMLSLEHEYTTCAATSCIGHENTLSAMLTGKQQACGFTDVDRNNVSRLPGLKRPSIDPQRFGPIQCGHPEVVSDLSPAPRTSKQ